MNRYGRPEPPKGAAKLVTDDEMLAAALLKIDRQRELGYRSGGKQPPYIEPGDLAGWERGSYGGGWVKRQFETPFPDLTTEQVKRLLRRLVEQGKLVEFKRIYGKTLAFTTPELWADQIEKNAHAKRVEDETQQRWREVAKRCAEFGLDPPKPPQGWHPWTVPLETMEALLLVREVAGR